MDDVLNEPYCGLSGGHLGFNKTLDEVRQRYYWLQTKNDVEKWCRSATSVLPVVATEPQIWAKFHQYKVGAPIERKVIDVAGPFPRSDQGNRYLLIDYLTK
jgi:hypothetical protein